MEEKLKSVLLELEKLIQEGKIKILWDIKEGFYIIKSLYCGDKVSGEGIEEVDLLHLLKIDGGKEFFSEEVIKRKQEEIYLKKNKETLKGFSEQDLINEINRREKEKKAKK